MKNNFSKISLFISAAFFLMLSALSVFLYREIKNNNQKAEQENAEWRTEADKREEIISLNDSLQKISGDKTELETHFAKSSDVVPFLNTIENLAPEAGATAEIDSVDTGTDNSLSIGLKASGSFEALYKFLTLLENSPYELDFLSMDLHKLTMPETPGKTVTKIPQWEAVFEIKLLTFLP